jgi:hypothetical protein
MSTAAALALSAVLLAQPATSAPPDDAGYLLSANAWHADPEVFWPGFLSGLRGFEKFYNPIGNPIYFEPPTNTSELRFLYIRHNFPDDVVQGGNVQIAALQARLALTERLSFIATKDGYSWLDAGAFPEEEGWNALAAGLKYTFYADRENDFLAAAGIRYMLDSGESKILQGGVDELSPFLSIAKAWGPFQVTAATTYRFPLDSGDGNEMFHWDISANYELFRGFAPVAEVRGMHYLSNGDRTALPVGGADYTNLGSTDVSGDTIVAIGFGARARLTPHIMLGALYEFNVGDDDIFDDRFTIDLILRW